MKTIKKHSFLRVGLCLAAAACALFGAWTMKKSDTSVAQAAVKGTSSVHVGDMLEAKDYKLSLLFGKLIDRGSEGEPIEAFYLLFLICHNTSESCARLVVVHRLIE